MLRQVSDELYPGDRVIAYLPHHYLHLYSADLTNHYFYATVISAGTRRAWITIDRAKYGTDYTFSVANHRIYKPI